MEAFVLFVFAAAICALAIYLTSAGRLRRPIVLMRPQRDGEGPDLAPLIRSLYISLISPSNRTWHTQEVHVSATELVALAHPDDAPKLRRSLVAVNKDLNAALKDTGSRNRLVVQLPVRVVDVLDDEDTPSGDPVLVPRAERVRPSLAVVAAGGRTIDEFELEGEPRAMLFGLGGGLAAPVVVPRAGLTLGRADDLGAGRIVAATVSNRHALVRWEPEGWVIRDLESKNGVHVDGLRIERPHMLEHGDVIGLGRKVRLRFVVGDRAFAATVEGDPE